VKRDSTIQRPVAEDFRLRTFSDTTTKRHAREQFWRPDVAMVLSDAVAHGHTADCALLQPLGGSLNPLLGLPPDGAGRFGLNRHSANVSYNESSPLEFVSDTTGG
jgi:hypothetical protein